MSLHASATCYFHVREAGVQGTKLPPLNTTKRKRRSVHRTSTRSYTHMLLLLSSCHLWSGCHHLIHQICHIDLFLLTGHLLGDEICFMNSICVRMCVCIVRVLKYKSSKFSYVDNHQRWLGGVLC